MPATGHAVPQQRRSSAEIERELGLDEGWIQRRTGIRERPVVSDDEATSDLSVTAAQRALDDAPHVAPGDVDLLLLATSTPDHLLPPSAPQVAHRLGLDRAGAVDVTGACAGFLYALAMADALGQTRGYAVLVVGANVLSYRTNPADPATAALFGDGAGAVVLTPKEADGVPALRGLHLGADGSAYERIQIPAGGSRRPMTAEAVRHDAHLMQMKSGRAVFRSAVETMVAAGRKTLADADLTTDDVDWWVPHQANQRITDRAGEALGLPPERTVSIIERYGNSSAATIPLALSLASADGRLQRGDRVLLTAVGAGMIDAGAVLEWGDALRA
ncbi:MAG: ketoacyl-ACP synthase III [Bacteroidetes bacterium QS_8_68_15]|nr:MAG: ketoacyl-ACP synthase III [Bacteroidetes bacterium QS_8_68_15]